MPRNREWFEENARSAIRKRNPHDQASEYARYQETLLRKVGIDTAARPHLLASVIGRMQEAAKTMHFALFDDALPSLQALKARGLILALVTNVETGMDVVSRQLGLEKLIDVIATSGEVGQDKPAARIFLAAMERAGVTADEVVHVGDQYAVDVVGARGVGIAPLLLDRYDLSPGVTDCPRIHSLSEVSDYVA